MKFHATTILAVEKEGRVAMGGDGQVTLGDAVMKADAMKIRKLLDGKVLCGFAGSSADAFALMERFETYLKDSPKNITKAATELAKQWRMDKALRQLDLGRALAATLTYRQQRQLDDWLPTRYEVPSGSRIALRYGPPGRLEPPVSPDTEQLTAREGYW